MINYQFLFNSKKNILSFIIMVLAIFFSVGCFKKNNCDESNKTTECGAPNDPSGANNGGYTDAISTGSLSLVLCAISDGKVKCIGPQLGDGGDTNLGDKPDDMGAALSEISFGQDNYVISVVASNTPARCVLFASGAVKCWGDNTLGQLGLGDVINRVNYSSIVSLPNINLGQAATSIAAGNRSFCALLSDGQIKCWGAFTTFAYNPNNPGFIGDSTDDLVSLKSITLPLGRYAKKIIMGDANNCALLDNDKPYCWNYKCTPTSFNYVGPNFSCTDMASSWGPLGTLQISGTIKDMSIGSVSSCILLTEGNVKCWGGNDAGQLGQGDTVSRAVDNNSINDLALIPNIDLGANRTALKISMGETHVCAILDNHNVKCWGNNLYGQLGLEDKNNRGDNPNEMGDQLPIVQLGSGRTAIDISSGVAQTCALLDDHSVKCWGLNSDGRLGQGDTIDRGGQVGTMGDSLFPIHMWK